MSLCARWLSTVAVLSLSFSLFACGGDPPDREIQQAEAAIAIAQKAGADRYATDELTAAKDALKLAREAVAARDYRLALNHALDSLERAETAATAASTDEAAARAAAAPVIAAAASALDAATDRIKAAEAARVSPRILAGPRARLADAATRVQEARTAWDAGDYAAATAAATAATEHAREAMAALETVPVPPARRPR